MSKLKGFVKLLSLTATLCVTFTAVGSGINAPQVNADYYSDYGYGYDYGGNGYYDYDYGYDYGYDYDYGYGYSDDYGYGYDDGYGYDYSYDYSTGWTDPAAGQTDTDDSSGAEQPEAAQSAMTQISEYAKGLRDIVGKQSALKIEISDADTAIREEEKILKSIQKRTDELDKELYILNRSMTMLEVEVNSNRREMERLDRKISDGTSRLKMRLRALYLSGSDSYTTVLLESDSFYDVLMRMELIKRVAAHDDGIIDELYVLQEKFNVKQAELDLKQAELNKQYALFDAKKAKLDEIYNSSTQARQLLEEKQKKLKVQEAQFNLEKLQQAQALSGVLKQPSGMIPFDDEVAATMVLADARLEELQEDIRARARDGEEFDDYDPTYTFAWPVPSSLNITSGVGARWGAYHKGIDIGAYHGSPIIASDSGIVLMTNTTCTHDYGKYESCGCGGGYGNYVIIDHGNDFLTLYGHMTKVLVEPGDMVRQGDIIGMVGSTGYSTGDHLHFEIRYEGCVLNPTGYVDISIVPGSRGDRNNSSDEDEIVVTETDKDRESDTVKVEEQDESSGGEPPEDESSDNPSSGDG